jgi:hypothetical protein
LALYWADNHWNNGNYSLALGRMFSDIAHHFRP